MLGVRWQVMADHPLVRAALRAGGVDEKAIQEVVEDPVIKELLARLARRKTLLAYVPRLPQSDHDGWLLVTWAGGYTLPLSWVGSSPLIKEVNLKKTRSLSGRNVYTIHLETSGSHSELSLAETDGVLMACLSRDPRGARHMLERIARRDPIIEILEDRMTRGPAGEGRDRGWYMWAESGHMGGEMKRVAFGFNADILSRAQIWAKGDTHLLGLKREGTTALGGTPPRLGSGTATVGLEYLLGKTPWAFAAFSRDVVSAVAADYAPSNNIRVAWKHVEDVTVASEPVFGCLLGGEYRDRLAGLAIPGWLVGAKARADVDVDALARSVLDRLNAECQLGWIPTRDQTTGFPGIVVGSTKPGSGTTLMVQDEHRSAVILRDRRLLLGGTVTGLQTLLTRDHAVDAPGGTAEWASGLTSRPALAYLWMDLGRTRDELMNLSAVWVMSHIGKSARKMDRAKEDQRRLIAAMQELSSLSTLELWVDINGEEFTARLDLGR